MIKMNKKIITIMFGMILLVAIVTAGVISFSLTPATITINEKVEQQKGMVTFDCDGTPAYIMLGENNLDIDDDFERAIQSGAKRVTPIVEEVTIEHDDWTETYENQITRIECSELTNIEDWTGRVYKTDTKYPELKSFDELKLKENVCEKDGMDYDEKTEVCVERVTELTDII